MTLLNTKNKLLVLVQWDFLDFRITRNSRRSFPHEVKVNFTATQSGKLIALYVPALTHMRN